MDITACTNGNCNLKDTCERWIGPKEDLHVSQSYTYCEPEYNDDAMLWVCEMYLQKDESTVIGENLFGGAETTPGIYHSELGNIFLRYEDGQVGAVETNKALLLTMFEFYTDGNEALAEYRKIQVEHDSHAALVTQLKQWSTLDEDNKRKIPMIKHLRHITGWGLKASKEWIDERFVFDSKHILAD